MANGNKPVKKFSAGAISAAVWKNTRQNGKGQNFDVESVTLDRRYKDGDDWKSSSSFRLNDLPKVQLVLAKAYEYLATKKQDGEDTPEEPVY